MGCIDAASQRRRNELVIFTSAHFFFCKKIDGRSVRSNIRIANILSRPFSLKTGHILVLNEWHETPPVSNGIPQDFVGRILE